MHQSNHLLGEFLRILQEGHQRHWLASSIYCMRGANLVPVDSFAVCHHHCHRDFYASLRGCSAVVECWILLSIEDIGEGKEVFGLFLSKEEMPEEARECSACMDQHVANPHTVRLQHSQRVQQWVCLLVLGHLVGVPNFLCYIDMKKQVKLMDKIEKPMEQQPEYFYLLMKEAFRVSSLRRISASRVAVFDFSSASFSSAAVALAEASSSAFPVASSLASSSSARC